MRIATRERGDQAAEVGFVPVFQPEIDLQSGRADRLEVLLRRRNPGGTLEPAGGFLDDLRRADRLAAVCAATDAAALRQGAAWLAAGRSLARLALNLDGAQVRGAGWSRAFLATVEASGFAPDRVEVELSERILADVPVQPLIDELHRLRAAGVGIALDDFGVGHASLSQLALLPIDVVKIDGSLLRLASGDARARRIVGATVTLVHDLGFGCVLEGIEDAADLALARDLGADYGQGYGLAPPLPAAAVGQLLPAAPRLRRAA